MDAAAAKTGLYTHWICTANASTSSVNFDKKADAKMVYFVSRLVLSMGVVLSTDLAKMFRKEAVKFNELQVNNLEYLFKKILHLVR